ncbi:SulP family inorganic anion transporter [Nocardiopsis sp. EMB25]|uniref:SulP family inorganic anion transporter n=1 Tax=Nocardiopsis sp. EMB25 TaxID=2835867 RepID=UPI003FA36D03
MGLLRLGGLADFPSRSVLSGFTSASAVLVVASRVRDPLGLDAARSATPPGTAAAVVDGLTTAHGAHVARPVRRASGRGRVRVRRGRSGPVPGVSRYRGRGRARRRRCGWTPRAWP